MLKPFHPCHAQEIQDWNLDPTYGRFWRGITRHLTFDECSHLPQVLGCEVLIIGDTRGLVDLREEDGVVKFSILIDNDSWHKGLGRATLLEIENYCFKKKGARALMTECSTEDVASNTLIDKGYTLVGTIPEHSLFNGKYESVNIYYKRNPIWAL